jgi:hypothetical protein
MARARKTVEDQISRMRIADLSCSTLSTIEPVRERHDIEQEHILNLLVAVAVGDGGLDSGATCVLRRAPRSVACGLAAVAAGSATPLGRPHVGSPPWAPLGPQAGRVLARSRHSRAGSSSQAPPCP